MSDKPLKLQVREYGATLSAGSVTGLHFGLPAGTSTRACNCIGPQNGQPKCPCQMQGIVERDGRWIQLERDLGPVSTWAASARLTGAHQRDHIVEAIKARLCPTPPNPNRSE